MNTPSSSDQAGRLRLLCVGAGRDGTTSLSRLIQNIFDRENKGKKALHEYYSVEYSNSFCEYKESGNQNYLDRLRQISRSLDVEAMVGNGYAPLLPMIAEERKGPLILVHLIRRDKEAFARSFMQNIRHFPENHRYYSDSPAATSKRMTAFHFGEATEHQWFSWTLHERISWYYDKTHTLIDTYKHLFDEVVEIETESLNRLETRTAISGMLGCDFVVPPVHINRHLEMDGLSDSERQWIHIYLANLDVGRFANDDVYGISHVLETFRHRVRHTLSRGSQEDREDILSKQDGMIDLLARALEQLRRDQATTAR